MRYVFLVLSALVLLSCSSKESALKQQEKQALEEKVEDDSSKVVDSNKREKEESKESLEILDLVNIPQNIEYFTSKVDDSVETYDIQKKYEKYYFNVWNDVKPRESLNTIKWPFYSYRVGNSYGENFQLLKQEFFDAMLENANFKNYATLNKKAITLREVNIRAFPTIKPLLRDPKKAGEGFPFDYLQNSTLHANKPIFVSHYSKDRAWVYVFSSFASGWIESNEMVFLEQQYVDAYKNAQQVFFIKEDIPLYSENGTFLFNSKIGMMLALIAEDDSKYEVLVISSCENLEPIYERVKISKNIAAKTRLNLNGNSLREIMSEVFKSNYGWGGMYGQRDCSSTLRDMFAPFGIWLPRNSSQQARVGKIIKLEKLSDAEKIAIIKEKGIPFQTLLYKKGHIVLYVGVLNDEIIVFHNTWGIKTMKDGIEGRVVIGKTIFSTLRVGKDVENYDEEAELLRNLKSMNILTQ